MKGAEQLARSRRGSQRGAGRAGRGQDTGTGCPPPAGGCSRLRAASAGCAGPAGAGGGSRGFGFSPCSSCILEAHRLSVVFCCCCCFCCCFVLPFFFFFFRGAVEGDTGGFPPLRFLCFPRLWMSLAVVVACVINCTRAFPCSLWERGLNWL